MKYSVILLILTFQAFALDISDYITLLEKSEECPWINVESETFSWDNYPSNVKSQFLDGIKAQQQLDSIPASEALPILFDLFEQKWGDHRPCIVYYEKIGYKTNTFVEAIAKQIKNQGGLTFGSSPYGCVAFPWLNLKNEKLGFNEYEIQYFWWIYDRKHLPVIWNTWYECWGNEFKREKPRKLVLNQMALDITKLGFYIFPYVYEKLSSGDNTLLRVVKIFQSGVYCPKIRGDFSLWWNDNKDKYSLPAPKGWEHAAAKISENTLPLPERVMKEMLKWHDLAEQFYSEPKNNYWYYFLKDCDDLSENDINDAIIKSMAY